MLPGASILERTLDLFVASDSGMRVRDGGFRRPEDAEIVDVARFSLLELFRCLDIRSPFLVPVFLLRGSDDETRFLENDSRC